MFEDFLVKSAELLYNRLECGGSEYVFAVMALQYLVQTAGYIDVFFVDGARSAIPPRALPRGNHAISDGNDARMNLFARPRHLQG